MVPMVRSRWEVVERSLLMRLMLALAFERERWNEGEGLGAEG